MSLTIGKILSEGAATKFREGGPAGGNSLTNDFVYDDGEPRDPVATNAVVVYDCALHLAGGIWSHGVTFTGCCRIHDNVYRYMWRDTEPRTQLLYNPHHTTHSDTIAVFDEYPYTRADLKAQFGDEVILDVYWDAMISDMLAFANDRATPSVQVLYRVEASYQ